MKVITPGRPQVGWSIETNCSGKGNGGGGCNARLLVEQPDLYRTSRQSYGDSHPEYFSTFQCPECSVETDIPNEPSHVMAAMLTKTEYFKVPK